MRRAIDTAGYREIKTPQVMDARQWEQSGHWGKYRENMFVIPDAVPNTEEGAPLVAGDYDWMALKPMNCPAHVLVFRQGIKSYRDLPLRLYENGSCHRNEPHGALHGLMRVRQFTQDDAHIYCRLDQLQGEITMLLEQVKDWYRPFGLEPLFKLSTRPAKSLGTDEQWQVAEQGLADALRANGLAFDLNPGDGTFYGPKIDVDILDALARRWQIATIQIDFQQPERFGLEYIDSDGQPKRPVMVHRAIFGSFERFIGILTEHYAGAFPTWLAPVQARVIPISEKFADYARGVHERLRAAHVRSELDDRNEKLGYRIREAQLRKVPYMLVCGGREAEAGTVGVRHRTGDDVGAVPLDRVVADLVREIGTRAASLTVGRS
jgi:threonyl-tRNA synthetase